jgi:hypothetical protein
MLSAGVGPAQSAWPPSPHDVAPSAGHRLSDGPSDVAAGDVVAAGGVAPVGDTSAGAVGSGVADPPVADLVPDVAERPGAAGAAVAPRRPAGAVLDLALLDGEACLALAAADACRARADEVGRDAPPAPARPVASAGGTPRCGAADESGIVNVAGEERAGAAGAGGGAEGGSAGAIAGEIAASMFAEPMSNDSTPTPIPSPLTSINGTATISWCTVSRTGSPRSRAGQGSVVLPHPPHKPHPSHERCARRLTRSVVSVTCARTSGGSQGLPMPRTGTLDSIE